ncbi:hypothetical protein OOZ15_19145 [Galbibacter sp. EGI 63066]|uniref:M61 family metallopeptidase n=1 Tax=Galbibacter sp. EGI 63066 TaxID=2993559 RepID=UPI002249522D|nr:hypothetical protein [Galbibacter sp. EGI 63066]MCX2682074.1 hypothetical protein [Galbibacter sp. EGI 63066]
MNLKGFTYFVLLIFLVNCSVKDKDNHSENTIIYEITPVPLDDRVNLTVKTTFQGNSNGITTISLPDDKYGTDEIYRSIAEFTVSNGQVETVFGEPKKRVIHHQPSKVITINYTISFDPKLSETSSFSPVIEPELFHFFYPQWMLTLSLEKKEYEFDLHFNNVPNNWVTFTNLSKTSENHFSIRTNLNDFKPFIAGGDYDYYKIESQGKPINVIISHHFRDELEMVEDIQTIINYQRQLFDFSENEHFLISVTKRDGILAGTGIENAFVALVRKGASNPDLLQLLAHETLHNWIPLMADIERDKTGIGSEYETEFFNEGITSYAPRIMLLNQKLINRQQLVDMLNETLLKYSLNQHHTVNIDEIKKVDSLGLFDNVYEKVSYYRGDLLGFKWDNIIRKTTENKENIEDFLYKIIQKALENKGEISFPDFFAIAETYGIDAKSDWDKHIRDGKHITLNDLGWLSNDYKLIQERNTFFDKGFKSKKVENRQTIKEVYNNSNAQKAGLREEMVILKSEFNRNKPFASITVLDNSAQRTITYQPNIEVSYQKIILKH